jgi:hypothetical protein
MDWLKLHSPMHVDWFNKWMYVTIDGQFVQLHGLQPSLPVHSVVELCLVTPVNSEGNSSCLSQQEIPDQLLQEPQGLPPSRSCDHSIPLLPDAQPVNIRPYRFSSTMKDEIEAQVKEMLHKGLIQHSKSSFSSPILLVKKKDNTWRFCVDYRHLNALTVKSKYPVPIIDELFDELHGASWFTSLDLRAGFHQILMQPGEEFKTAFQTHIGHFEFRVMAFGLIGTPGTFQKAMNTTLQPLLRVLVFFDDILVYSSSLEEHVKHLHQVFQLLQADQWKVKLSKCSFAPNQVSYLGHVISQ